MAQQTEYHQHPLPILADPDESASPWRWVRRLLPLVAMGVGVGLQPGSLVIFSGAAALDPHSAIIFFGAILSVPAMTVSHAFNGTKKKLGVIICPVATLLLYIRHCRRLIEANCLKCSGLWCRTLSIENYIGKKNFVVPCFYAAMPHVFPNVVG